MALAVSRLVKPFADTAWRELALGLLNSPIAAKIMDSLLRAFRCADARSPAGVCSMAKSKKKAEVVFLVCDETGDLNYILRRKPGGEKLKLKKYCPRLRKHTLHTEKKK